MPFVETTFGPASYVVSGADVEHAPIILFHGAGGSHLDWPPAFRRFSGRRTYGVDLPGHGRTPPPGRRSIEAYAEWVIAWLDAMEMPPAVLVGHSMGGAIALDLARRAPGRVSALVVIGAGAKLPVAPAILGRIVAAPVETIAYVIRHAYGPAAPQELLQLGAERMAQIEPAVLGGDFAACDAFDMTGRLHEITRPALILAGGEDRMAPAQGARALHAGLPGSELVVFEDAGHMLIFERTDEIIRAIEDFLDGQDSQ